MKLRPEVRRFAEWMEYKLRQNDHKGGWEGCTLDYLLTRLSEEVLELADAAQKEIRNGIVVGGEAADVANFAIMIASLSPALKKGYPKTLEVK